MPSQKNILIVEDDEELRSIYRQALEREAFVVHEAADGADALEHLEKDVPDLAILDMMMPRMGGPTLLQMLRQNPALSEMRIVVITAYPQFRESALSYDVDQFLTKPVRPAEIVQAVRAALENS